ncbi:MAG: manganese efflux pump [Spirochaetes bacterium]|nr:manganese efflux pump [Spirochaetota bacterium]
MNLVNILFIAVGLSMDAFAVSVTNGIIIEKIKIRHALLIAVSFGVFQAVMPVIGWAGGLAFRRYIESVDHWIAFILLVYIGIKMILESRKTDPDDRKVCMEKSCLNPRVLILMSIATSIDALAVGITFSILKVEILSPVIIIGLITFVICFSGIYLGKKVGHFFEKKVDIFGGLILILIGIKILLEHLVLK